MPLCQPLSPMTKPIYMKNAYFLLLIVFIFSSCLSERPIEDRIIGKWKVETVSAGREGGMAEPTKKIIYRFKADTYKICHDGEVVSEGTYRIIEGESLLSNKTVDFVEFDGDHKSIVSFEGRELHLTGDCPHCGGAILCRK